MPLEFGVRSAFRSPSAAGQASRPAGRPAFTLAARLCLALALTAGCDRGPSPAPIPAPQASPWFEDFTARAKVHFVHQAETSGRHLFSESIGSGAAFLDFDNDGRLDLYLIHNVHSSAAATNSLFQQQPDGSFRDVSAGSGLDVTGYGNGLAVGDVNNDGFPEILITEYDRVRLFLNLGNAFPVPRFVDITAAAGITNRHWSVPAAFVDYDRDGWLDLVIGNYLDFDPTQKCPDAKGHPDFCGPHGFHSTITRLFRNLGNAERGTGNSESSAPGVPRSAFPVPRFEDVTISSGISRAPGKAMQIVCADFDGDHWPDLFITDDGLPNRLFVNQRNGKFKEEAVARGLAYTGMGATAANMGIALGDADGDGWFDLFVPHLAEENHTLWRQAPRGLFQDVTARSGLLGLPWHGTGFGTVFADFDGDGALDLAVANGAIRRRPVPSSKVQSPKSKARSGTTLDLGPWTLDPGIARFWMPYAEPSQLFANSGDGRFREISAASPALCGDALVGRGLACGDFDNDGAPDLLLIGLAGPVRLLRNVASPHGHWLGVRAIDPALGSRDAYGAEIVVQAGGRRWWRLIQPAYSYASSNDPRVQVGLGSVGTVDSIQVRWPDGLEEVFPGGSADRYLTLRRGSGTKSSR